MLTNSASAGLKAVPGAMIAVPFASPSGMGAGFVGAEQRVELLLRDAQQFLCVHRLTHFS
jgi:hypothetical protein